MKNYLLVLFACALLLSGCTKDEGAKPAVTLPSSTTAYTCTYTWSTHTGGGTLYVMNYGGQYWMKSKMNSLSSYDSIRIYVSGSKITIPATTTMNKGAYHGNVTISGDGSFTDPTINLTYSASYTNTDGNLHDDTYFYSLVGHK